MTTIACCAVVVVVVALPIAYPDPFIRGWNGCIDLAIWNFEQLAKALKWCGL